MGNNPWTGIDPWGRISLGNWHKNRNRENYTPEKQPGHGEKDPYGGFSIEIWRWKVYDNRTYKDSNGHTWSNNKHAPFHGGYNVWVNTVTGSEGVYNIEGDLVPEMPYGGTFDYFPPYDSDGTINWQEIFQHGIFDTIPHFIDDEYENSENTPPDPEPEDPLRGEPENGYPDTPKPDGPGGSG